MTEDHDDPLAPVEYRGQTFRAGQVWGAPKVAKKYERTITAIHGTRVGHIVFFVEGKDTKKNCTIGDFYQWTVTWGATVKGYDQWKVRQKRENKSE